MKPIAVDKLRNYVIDSKDTSKTLDQHIFCTDLGDVNFLLNYIADKIKYSNYEELKKTYRSFYENEFTDMLDGVNLFILPISTREEFLKDIHNIQLACDCSSHPLIMAPNLNGRPINYNLSSFKRLDDYMMASLFDDCDEGEFALVYYINYSLYIIRWEKPFTYNKFNNDWVHDLIVTAHPDDITLFQTLELFVNSHSKKFQFDRTLGDSEHGRNYLQMILSNEQIYHFKTHNMLPMPISGDIALNAIFDELCPMKEGEYLTSMSLGTEQMNNIMVDVLLRKYSRKYRKMMKKK